MSEQNNQHVPKDIEPSTSGKGVKKKKKKQTEEDANVTWDVTLAETDWNILKPKKRNKKFRKKPDQTSENSSSCDLKEELSDRELLLPPTKLDPAQEIMFEENYIHVLEKRYSKNPFAKFQCKLCKYHCDNIQIVEHHVQDTRHLKALDDDTEKFTLKHIPSPTPRQIECISNLLLNQVRDFGLSDEELCIREIISSELNDAISKELPGFAIRVFGSTAMGLALKDSDLNMELCVPEDGNRPMGLAASYEYLSHQTEKYKDVKSDFSAELPAVRFVTTDSLVNCVLTLSDNHSFKTAHLIRKYVMMDERVKKLGIAFRVWAHLCKLDNVDLCMLPAYAFALMLIHFLQQLPKPVLPVLHISGEYEVQKNAAQDSDDPRDVEEKDEWMSEEEKPLGELWLLLFKFYVCDFNVDENVVCIEQRRPMLRRENIRNWYGKKMAIKDPFRPKRNVSHTMSAMAGIEYSSLCFRNTYKYFSVLQTKTGPIFRGILRPLKIKNDLYRKNMQEKENLIKDLLAQHVYFMKSVTKPTTVEELEKEFLSRAKNSQNNNFYVTEVPEKWAKEMFSAFNDHYLQYDFEPLLLVGNQKFPQICRLCQREGHTKEDCQEEMLDTFEVDLPPMDDFYVNALDVLCEQVTGRWEMTPRDKELRQDITTKLEQYIQQFYPTAKLELFGSSCNGFGLTKSDIDICLTFTDSEDGKEHDFVKLIENLQGKLKKYHPVQQLIPITTAKVPILKFFHEQSDLEGDLSIYNTLGKQNTKLLKTYSEIDIRAKMLGYMIKRFGKACDICNASKGSLSSYAYIIMLIYFLQQCDPPVLPVLQELSDVHPKPKVVVEQCDTYFYDNIPNLKNLWPDFGKNKCSPGELWIQLLRFYSVDFEYSNIVISIRKKEKLGRFEKMWTSKCMAIEDPFDLTHNLAVGLSRKMHCYIIRSFRKGYLHFGDSKTEALMHKSLFEAYFFRTDLLSVGEPPNDRGCRICKKIGHRCKDCPQRKQKKPRTQNKNAMQTSPAAKVNTVPPVFAPERFNYVPAPVAQPVLTFCPPTNLPSFRSAFLPPQDNPGVRYGFQRGLPPFRSGGPPVVSSMNGAGFRPQGVVARNVRPAYTFNPMRPQDPPANRDHRMQECETLLGRIRIDDRERARGSHTLSFGNRPRNPPNARSSNMHNMPTD